MLIWFTGSVFPILIDISSISKNVAALFNFTYTLVCHSDPNKLFCLDSNCSIVCSRCLGIYLGAAVTSMFTLFIKTIDIRSVKPLFAVSAIMLIEVISYNVGFYSYNKFTAILTGLLFGSCCFLYIRTGLEKLIAELKK
jgi:uncharacterized membrane protein